MQTNMQWMGTRLALVVVLGLTFSLAGCNDEITGPAPSEFEELCGDTAPLRLLPLAPDRVPERVTGKLFGDRYIFSLGFGDISEDDGNEVWSVGRCGEDPVRLIDGVSAGLSRYEELPDIPFVCTKATGQLLALDPSGVQSPHEAFETRGCSSQWTPHGLVTILGDGDTGPLILQPWPEDPLTETAEQIVLVDEVKARALPSPHTSGEHEVLRAAANEVFAITAADELVAVSLDTLEVSVLAQGAREIDVAPSGRFVLWQSVEITNDNPEWPEGPIFLLDRASGETTQLDDTALAYTMGDSFTLEPFGLLHYRVGAIDDETADRWVRLDTLDIYALPGLIWPWYRIDDTRALFGRWGSKSPLYVFDISTGELTEIYDGDAYHRIPHEDGLWILHNEGGELVDLSYAGESRTLALHVTDGWEVLDGHRVVTPFAVGSDGIGSLVIVDPETLEERYIDHDVRARSTNVFGEWPDGGDLISYLVLDDDPERLGIWLAKPAK